MGLETETAGGRETKNLICLEGRGGGSIHCFSVMFASVVGKAFGLRFALHGERSPARTAAQTLIPASMRGVGGVAVSTS